MQPYYASAEPETKDWMCDYILPDWTVFDVGAHIGQFTMLMSLKALYGEVYAFEPSEVSRKMLSANMAHNDGKWGHRFTNVHLFPLAVGDKSGRGLKETLWLTDGTDQYGKTTAEFDMTTLDDFCLTHNMVQRVDFIKCDVDGWDYEVLLGAQKVLERFRPYLIVECNYAMGWRGHTQADLEQILSKYNYQHKVIDPTPCNWLCWPEEKDI